MNKHVSPQRLGDPALTPAERVTALMDAFVKFQQLSQATHDLRVRLMTGQIAWDDVDGAVIVEARARVEVVAQVKILMGAGILERCSEMLEIDTPTALAKHL